jgi:hypothetical protein
MTPGDDNTKLYSVPTVLYAPCAWYGVRTRVLSCPFGSGSCKEALLSAYVGVMITDDYYTLWAKLMRQDENELPKNWLLCYMDRTGTRSKYQQVSQPAKKESRKGKGDQGIDQMAQDRHCEEEARNTRAKTTKTTV